MRFAILCFASCLAGCSGCKSCGDERAQAGDAGVDAPATS